MNGGISILSKNIRGIKKQIYVNNAVAANLIWMTKIYIPLIPAEQRFEPIFCFTDSSASLEDFGGDKICDVEGTGCRGVKYDSGELGAYSRGSVTRVSALRNLYLIFTNSEII